MKKFSFKHLICIFFMLAISTPLILGFFSAVLGRKLDVALTKDNADYKAPVFSVTSFADGVFQTRFEKYFNTKFKPRGCITRTYNQLNLLLFNQTQATNLEVNNGYIYEKAYLDDYAGLTYNPANPEIQQELDDYMKALEEVSKKLAARGKKLIVYSAPSKCEYTEEHIPAKYKRLKDENDYSRSAIDYFNEHISEYGVTYINYRPLLSDLQYPVFYKNGIHWSRPAEQTVSQKIVETIDDFIGNVKPIKFSGVRQSYEQIYREEDMKEVANLWFGANEIYYEYETEGFDETLFSKPAILIQGDSFSEGLFNDIRNNGITDMCYLIFYNNFVKDINNEFIIDIRDVDESSCDNVWELLEIPRFLEQTDVVCVEFCSAIMNLQSSGFIYHLNEILGD